MIPEAWRAAGFARVARLRGNFGAVGHAFVRADERGFTLVGEGILDLVDPATVDEEMAACEREYRAWIHKLPSRLQRGWDHWDQPFVFQSYSCWDAERQKRIPLRHAQGQFGASWSVASLDGEAMRWLVARLVRHA